VRDSKLPIYLSIGACIGVLGAYLIAGGASYEPLAAADPCESRSLEVLSERGVLEGVVLSALDGAACDLGVSREELTLAIADDAALAAFAEEHGVSEDEVDSAVRSGLIRAVDDAEAAGLLSGTVASIARLLAENAPIAATLDAFRAIPGEPGIGDLIAAAGELQISLSDLQEALGELGVGGIEDLDSILEDLLGRAPG
jgi:hypothetical protein